MNHLSGLLLTLAVLALCAACLRMGPGFKSWPRTDKINYLVLVIAAWPWLILGFFVEHLPTWYTVTAFTVAGGSLVWFIVSMLRFLHESRRTLRQLQADIEARFPDTPEDCR